jgi:hypothetical protein
MQRVSCARCQTLHRRLHARQAENERLRRQRDEATRARKRQAAPFAKGQPTAAAKKPGRKPGTAYGRKGHRQPPNPEQIDEVHEAPLPSVQLFSALKRLYTIESTAFLRGYMVTWLCQWRLPQLRSMLAFGFPAENHSVHLL